MKAPTLIAEISAQPLDMPMRETFTIAGGTQTSAANVLVSVRLSDGTRGYGECAPFPAFNDETQKGTLSVVRRAASWLTGKDARRAGSLARMLGRRLPHRGCARAGLEMAMLDAWSRSDGFPLYTLFGGAGDRVESDVSVPIMGPRSAQRAAARISALGVSTIKIKVGRDVADDRERVAAVVSAAPKARLLLDGNAGYQTSDALRLLRLLRRRGIRPELFEQPVPPHDWQGLRDVARLGRIKVAADESAASAADVLRLAERGAAQVVNIKLMKTGIFEAWEMARVARAAGLGLMIGGLVESPLAMACAAHLAAGIGGFDYVDLDTPLFLAGHPMRGVNIGRGGVWDLSKIKAGIGVRPRSPCT